MFPSMCIRLPYEPYRSEFTEPLLVHPSTSFGIFSGFLQNLKQRLLSASLPEKKNRNDNTKVLLKYPFQS